MHKLTDLLLDFIFPPHCPSCGKSVPHQHDWCKNCFEELYEPRYIGLENNSPLDFCYTLAHYDRGVRKILQDIKFNDKPDRVRALAPFFMELNLRQWAFDLVVPVPVSREMQQKRGYNQVDLLFRKRAVDVGLPWCDILQKGKKTQPMWGLEKEERRQNIKNAFFCTAPLMVVGKEIMLVDDVYTTGATLEELAHMLLRVGAKKIKALTVASGAFGKIH